MPVLSADVITLPSLNTVRPEPVEGQLARRHASKSSARTAENAAVPIAKGGAV